jgi:hypothetical protein
MDRVAEVSRLTGGFTFTGTSRHFIQYRDAFAPFGYDTQEILPTDSELVLYHSTFSQAYSVERSVELASFLLKLRLSPKPRARSARTDAEHREAMTEPAQLWMLAESGLAPSLLRYLVRSGVGARVGLTEWPAESPLDTDPGRRWLFRVADLPQRMVPLLTKTPGITVFEPVAAGVAVEFGYRHPVELRACGAFREDGLVLFRAGAQPPLRMERLPELADAATLAKLERASESEAVTLEPVADRPHFQISLRLAPASDAAGVVSATLVPPEQYPLLRRLLYILGPNIIRTTRIAPTPRGAFLVNEPGLERLPIGLLFRRMHSSIFIPCGMDLLPAVGGPALFSALGSPADRFVFMLPSDAAAVGQSAAVVVVAIETRDFSSLEQAMINPEAWMPLTAQSLPEASNDKFTSVWFEPLSAFPLRDVKAIE